MLFYLHKSPLPDPRKNAKQAAASGAACGPSRLQGRAEPAEAPERIYEITWF